MDFDFRSLHRAIVGSTALMALTACGAPDASDTNDTNDTNDTTDTTTDTTDTEPTGACADAECLNTDSFTDCTADGVLCCWTAGECCTACACPTSP